MTDVVRNAKEFKDLLALEANNTPYVFDKIFDAQSWLARQLSKRKFKLLQQIDPEICRMLEPDEKVFLLSWGVETSFLESYFLGWMLYYLNRAAIVVTSRRILFIQITTKDRPFLLRYQIRYPAIQKIGGTAFANTSIKFHNRKSIVLSQMPRNDQKVLKEMIGFLRKAPATQVESNLGREKLCPFCYKVVDGFPAACPHCGGTFKKASVAAWRSLLWPGLGDLYLGHRGIAYLEMLVAAAMWIGLFAGLTEDKGDARLSLTAFVVIAVFIFLIAHGTDAVVTRHMARKGHYPDKPGPTR